MRSLSIYLGAKRPLPTNLSFNPCVSMLSAFNFGDPSFTDASLSLSRIGTLLLTRAYILTYPRIMDGMDFVLLLGSRVGKSWRDKEEQRRKQ